MSNFPTVEQLAAMPLARLRLLDIQTSAQEALVQTVINSKLGVKPPATSEPPLRVPDIKNAEEEAFWQAKVDEKAAALREKPVQIQTEIPQEVVQKVEEVTQTVVVQPSQTANAMADSTTIEATVQVEEPKPQFTCTKCNETFSTPQGLSAHMRFSADDAHRSNL